MTDEYASSTTAAARVFAIPELLERIILHTHQCEIYKVGIATCMSYSEQVIEINAKRKFQLQQIRTILRSQLVNKTFYNTIMASKACISAIFREHAFKFSDNYTVHHLAGFNPVLLGVLELQCASVRWHRNGNRLYYFVEVQHEHFADLASELKRIGAQGTGESSW